jgi:hypothetical protein
MYPVSVYTFSSLYTETSAGSVSLKAIVSLGYRRISNVASCGDIPHFRNMPNEAAI